MKLPVQFTYGEKPLYVRKVNAYMSSTMGILAVIMCGLLFILTSSILAAMYGVANL